jgi:corrinoid protein of di/trimethylamine methyltransferase
VSLRRRYSNMPSKEELLDRMKDAVVKFDEEQVREAAQQFADERYDPLEGIIDGLAAGMSEVGKLFAANEYFVPEVLMCADALYEGLNILRPLVPKSDTAGKGKIILGTIQGDVHDIGKNLVRIMLDVGGFEVYDLGTDVPMEKFIEEQARINADIIAISAMMTTTMLGMKKLIPKLREKNPDVCIMVGGAPLTKEVAKLFGADGYANSAPNAVQEALRLIDRLREMHHQSEKQ